MATLKIFTNNILNNITKMNEFCKKYNKEWTLVTKVLSGYQPLLQEILQSDVLKEIHSVGDSRISSLKIIKNINPKVMTMYLKPPSAINIKKIITYADVSLNTEGSTIQKLNNEAKNQKKIHNVGNDFSCDSITVDFEWDYCSRMYNSFEFQPGIFDKCKMSYKFYSTAGRTRRTSKKQQHKENQSKTNMVRCIIGSDITCCCNQ